MEDEEDVDEVDKYSGVGNMAGNSYVRLELERIIVVLQTGN